MYPCVINVIMYFLLIDLLFSLWYTKSLPKRYQHFEIYQINPYHKVFVSLFSQLFELKYLLHFVCCFVS